MLYGYREGERQLVSKPLDSSTATVVSGDIMTLGTAGYHVVASAGNLPHGIAFEAATAPNADGGKSILVDTAVSALYEYPPDSGTVTAALVGTWVDVGGAQSIAIAATTDKVFYVERVDTNKNTVIGRFAFGLAAR